MPPPGRKMNAKQMAKKKAAREKAAQGLGAEMKATHAAEMAAHLKTFQEQLEAFAAKNKKQIQTDPQFRAQFNRMCREVGVDPLQSKKGFWASALGHGDFYYELGIQCIKVCISTRSQNGGLMDVDEMCRLLGRLRRAGEQTISRDDVMTAVHTLAPLGGGFQIRTVGQRSLIQSVPTELNDDHMSLLKLLDESGGHTSDTDLDARLGWTPARRQAALDTLLTEGLLWVDDQAPGGDPWYWSMCLTDNMDADLRASMALGDTADTGIPPIPV